MCYVCDTLYQTLNVSDCYETSPDQTVYAQDLQFIELLEKMPTMTDAFSMKKYLFSTKPETLNFIKNSFLDYTQNKKEAEGRYIRKFVRSYLDPATRLSLFHNQTHFLECLYSLNQIIHLQAKI